MFRLRKTADMILTGRMKEAHLRLMQTLPVRQHAAITLTERERRHGPIPRSNAATSLSQQGKAKACVVDGVTYRTQTEAARTLHVAVVTITRWVREGRAKLV